MIRQTWNRLVGLGFRLLYNELAFSYDAVSYVVSLGDWRQWQLAPLVHLPTPAQGRVLELAHGTGHLQQALHERGYDTIGYDLSRAMGRISGIRLTQQGYCPMLVRGMAQALPFADSTFSSIVCTFPTSFISQPQTLTECHRVLMADGRLIVVLNGVLSGNSPVKRAIDNAYRVTGQTGTSGLQPFADQMSRAGFSVAMHSVTSIHGFAQLIVAEKANTV